MNLDGAPVDRGLLLRMTESMTFRGPDAQRIWIERNLGFGHTLLKTTKVYVTAGDNVGVTRVDLLVDGKLYSTSSSATPVFSWNTMKVARGSHTLQAFAYDAAGNSTGSPLVTVNK